MVSFSPSPSSPSFSPDLTLKSLASYSLASYLSHRCLSILFLYPSLSLSTGMVVSVNIFPRFSFPSISVQSFLRPTTTWYSSFLRRCLTNSSGHSVHVHPDHTSSRFSIMMSDRARLFFQIWLVSAVLSSTYSMVASSSVKATLTEDAVVLKQI